VLQAQAFKSELPRGESAFAGQDKHVVAPSLIEYEPELQLVHVDGPVDSLYLPEGQAVHFPVLALSK